MCALLKHRKANVCNFPSTAQAGGFISVAGKRKRGKYRTYSPQQLKKAVSDHLEGGETLETASSANGVPLSTLSNYVARIKRGAQPRRAGRQTTLSFSEELLLVAFCLMMAYAGFPCTKKSIKDKAQAIAAKRGVVFRTKSTRPGQKWWRNFRRRWGQYLTMRKPSKTSPQKAALSRAELDTWYERLSAVMKQYNIRPEDVFNLDETGLDRIGGREPVAVAAGSDKAKAICAELSQHVTILTCIRSTGRVLPPFFIFRGAEGAFAKTRYTTDYLADSPAGSQCSKTGAHAALLTVFSLLIVSGMFLATAWITHATFTAWIKFFVAVMKPTAERPALILLDNHSSRFDYEMMDFAKQTT